MHKLYIPRDVAETIGRIVVEWAPFEITLRAATQVLAELPEVQDACIKQEPGQEFQRRLQFWRQAASLVASRPETIDHLYGKVAHLSHERQWVAHGYTMVHFDTGDIHQTLLARSGKRHLGCNSCYPRWTWPVNRGSGKARCHASLQPWLNTTATCRQKRHR